MTNEILTRAAEVLERSLTLENQTLAAELRRFDTAQREALAHAISGRSDAQEELVRALSAHDEAKAELAQVEAERAELWRQHREAAGELVLVQAVRAQMREDRDAALFQLTEVLRILDQHRAWTGMGWEQLPVPVHAVEKIRRKVAQAEQQVAVPRLVSYSEEMATCTLNYKGREYYFTLDGRSDEEAQGAQAGDERAAFETWTRVHNESLKDDYPDQSEDIKLDMQGGVYCWSNTDCAWKAWKARAALQAHPDLLEPWDVLEALADGYERGYQDGQSNPNGYSDKLAKHRVAAELLAAVRAQGDGEAKA